MKLRDSFLYLVRGIITGISSLVPGVSVGSISFAIGAYDDFINNIWQILKRKGSAIYIVVIPLIVGLIAGILGGSHLVDYFFTKYKVQTIFFFVGLLAGGYRLTIKNAKLKINVKNIIIFILSLVTTLLMQILVINSYTITSSNSYLNNFFTGLLSGIIFLLPGVSTSSVLLFFDKYNYLINSFTNLININHIITIILFIIGAIIGIFVIAKVISQYLKKYKTTCYVIISGLLTSSIIICLLEIDKIPLKFEVIFPSILTFLWGYIFTKNLAKE